MFGFLKRKDRTYAHAPVKTVDDVAKEYQSEEPAVSTPVEEPKAPEKFYRVDLVVKTKHREFSWGCPKETDDIAAHYRAFVSWYHGREKSKVFVMQHMEGCTCFRRKDILWYTITKREETRTEALARQTKDK